MRIALVCPYDCTVPGGVQTQVLALARALRSRGDEVAVVAPAGPGRATGCLMPRPSTALVFVGSGRGVPVAVNGSQSAGVALAGDDEADHLGAATLRSRRRARPRALRPGPCARGGALRHRDRSSAPSIARARTSPTAPTVTSSGGGRSGSSALTPCPRRRAPPPTACIGSLTGEIELIPNGVEVSRLASAEPWPTSAPDGRLRGPPRAAKGPRGPPRSLRGPAGCPACCGCSGEGPETARLRTASAVTAGSSGWDLSTTRAGEAGGRGRRVRRALARGRVLRGRAARGHGRRDGRGRLGPARLPPRGRRCRPPRAARRLRRLCERRSSRCSRTGPKGGMLADKGRARALECDMARDGRRPTARSMPGCCLPGAGSLAGMPSTARDRAHWRRGAEGEGRARRAAEAQQAAYEASRAVLAAAARRRDATWKHAARSSRRRAAAALVSPGAFAIVLMVLGVVSADFLVAGRRDRVRDRRSSRRSSGPAPPAC